MVGAFIGDLASWTWQNDKVNFYPCLISEAAHKTVYSDVILLTSQTLINDPDIPLDQFRATQEHAFGKNTAEYSVLRSIAIAWLYDSAENTRKAVQKYILHEEKEEWYAAHFLSQLIFSLRNGSTKNQAAQVEHLGTFRSFTKEEHWRTGDGTLSYVVRAWMSFYDAFDYGSTIHNAVKQPGNTTLNCILAGALADAMYGCENYYVKKQYKGGGHIRHLHYLNDEIYKINREKRLFFAKNNALGNVDKHHWMNRECPLEQLVISKELRRRILKAFYTGWDDRYGFYLDNGWIYVYRSGFVLSRFILKEQIDGTFRISNYQISDDKKDDIGIEEAMYSVQFRWDIISDEK